MNSLAARLAERLKELRKQRNWSLDQLAQSSNISRATLSRIENGSVSPTAQVLGKLCAVYALSMSRVLAQVEENFTALIKAENQYEWHDENSGFRRKNISPPSDSLNSEVLECELEPDSWITYSQPPNQGLERHLVMLSGELDILVNENQYHLKGGDCLRYQLNGPSEFRTPKNAGAQYLLVLAGN